MHAQAQLDYGRFDALTFDCYGTLIDWETGLTEAFRPVLRAHGVDADGEDVLVRYARHEAAAEAGAALPSLAGDLRQAARLFDDIWYGGRPAGPDTDARLRAVDERVRAARPQPVAGSHL